MRKGNTDGGLETSPQKNEAAKKEQLKAPARKTLTKKYMGASNFLKEFYQMQEDVRQILKRLIKL